MLNRGAQSHDASLRQRVNRHDIHWIVKTMSNIILTMHLHIPSNKATVIHIDKMHDEALFLLLGIQSIKKIQGFHDAWESSIVCHLQLRWDVPMSKTVITYQKYLNMLREGKAHHYSDDDRNSYTYTVATIIWRYSNVESHRSANSPFRKHSGMLFQKAVLCSPNWIDFFPSAKQPSLCSSSFLSKITTRIHRTICWQYTVSYRK